MKKKEKIDLTHKHLCNKIFINHEGVGRIANEIIDIFNYKSIV